MSYSLREFHFNSIKLGQILKQLASERKITYSYLSRATDITRDTLENIMTGKVHDVKFEQLFKICCVLEVPVEVIIVLMIKDEDIDFVDQIVHYDTERNEVTPVSEVVDAEQIPVSNTVVAVAEAIAATEKMPEPVQPSKTTEEYITFLQTHIERLTAMLDKAISKG